jgi:deoxyhypusine synthase
MFKGMSHSHEQPCQKADQNPRKYVRTRRVDECRTVEEIFLHCLPAFGGAYLRRIYQILDRAIGMGCPLTMAISGPVTVSGQHHTWLIPLLESGWVAYLSTTDAVCYHDGHRSLDAYKSGPTALSCDTCLGNITPRRRSRTASSRACWLLVTAAGFRFS